MQMRPHHSNMGFLGFMRLKDIKSYPSFIIVNPKESGIASNNNVSLHDVLGIKDMVCRYNMTLEPHLYMLHIQFSLSFECWYEAYHNDGGIMATLLGVSNTG
jgi:hypothetical protein